MPTSPDDLDAPLRGAAAIAVAANVVDKNGKPDIPATYYKLEKGHLPASKEGGTWISTKRRLRSIASGETVTA